MDELRAFSMSMAMLILAAGCALAPRTPTGADHDAVRERAAAAFPMLNRGNEDARSVTTDEPPQVVQGADVQPLALDASGCRWLRSRATISFGDGDTKQQALAQAVAQARTKALTAALGVDIRHRFFDFQQEGVRGETGLVESLLRTTQHGRILNERVIASGPEDLPGCRGCRFSAVIEACVAPLPYEADHGFRVSLALSETRLRDGQEVRAVVTSSRRAYLYVYSVRPDWAARQLFPHAPGADNHVRENDEVEFPSGALRSLGWRLVARLPAGESVAAETLRVVASREPLPASALLLGNPEGGDERRSFLDFLRALNALDVEWVEDVQAYTVVRPFSGNNAVAQ